MRHYCNHFWYNDKIVLISVIPVWKQPLPGWTDNINGPTGLLIGAGKGVIRTMYCNQDRYADYVPVDIAVNGLLVAAWNYISNKWVTVTQCRSVPIIWFIMNFFRKCLQSLQNMEVVSLCLHIHLKTTQQIL
jgi:hypothetical protein